MFTQGKCPVLLARDRPLKDFTYKGLLPALVELSNSFYLHQIKGTVRALPVSLAATKGISVDIYSSGYLDVSVPQVSPPKKDGMC